MNDSTYIVTQMEKFLYNRSIIIDKETSMNEYIALIGTGGTIAGQGTSETDLTDYTPGLLSLEDILADVPQAQDYGPFLYEQFSNIESSDFR